MKTPAWAVVAPKYQSCIRINLIARTRTQARQAWENWIGDPWSVGYKQGWRIVRITVEVAK